MAGNYPTLLTVDPALFRGTVPCGAPGLVHYVATLTDVSAPETLPSSAPTSCENYASFGRPLADQPGARGIQVDHLYVALIEGYDREVYVPTGSEGSRTMFDKATNEPVAPRWITSCGQNLWVVADAGSDTEADSGGLTIVEDDAGSDAAPPPFNTLRFPTQAILNREVTVRGCYPLSSALGPDASVGDAGTSDAEPPRDASIDHESPDGVPPDDAGDGATPDPDEGGSSG